MERWFNCSKTKPRALLKLFCFPWAGGGSNHYAMKWSPLLPDSIEVCAIRLPGRESRLNEKPMSDPTPLLDVLAEKIAMRAAGKPFAFWGHSMGTALAFRTALRLEKVHNMTPKCLLLSGAKPPQFSKRSDAVEWHLLPDAEFLQFIRRLGGTPEQVLRNEDLIKFFLPILRSDFELAYRLRYDVPDDFWDKEKVSCPLVIFGGEDDLSSQDLSRWKDLTGETPRTFPGGHFYFMSKENESSLLSVISKEVQ